MTVAQHRRNPRGPWHATETQPVPCRALLKIGRVHASVRSSLCPSMAPVVCSHHTPPEHPRLTAIDRLQQNHLIVSFRWNLLFRCRRIHIVSQATGEDASSPYITQDLRKTNERLTPRNVEFGESDLRFESHAITSLPLPVMIIVPDQVLSILSNGWGRN